MATVMTQRILELFDRDVDRPIEEVVKVDQTNAAVVREEIEEYVPTTSIKAFYRKILERYRETPNKPHEGIGIWISGFFGAGKSSFAKILGYALENRDLDGVSAAELFARQAEDPEIAALLRAINEQIPTKAVIFDVSTTAVVTDSAQTLTDIVYRVLIRELGYAADPAIAELEIQLENEGKLAAFVEAYARTFGADWDEQKHFAATARNRASRVLHELEPATYPHADSWARTPLALEINANFVARRAWELMGRRGGGRALVFIIDEVGQYVARSNQKMLDLQGLVQALGREGKNHAHEWKGQVWIVVTSQERLTEVVDNLGGHQVELARLQDRFATSVDLAPSDIREVTSQRVLKKKPSAKDALRSLYEAHKGKLAEATRLSGRLQGPPLDADTFADLYPFLPYQIDLLIETVSGLRTQAGASKHVGGANRTIIKLAQQVLINDETRLGHEPVGRLVTLAQVYELLKGLVATERRHDVDEIQESFGADAMETQVAKALALLQFVPSVARTPENLAVVLHPSVDAAPRRAEVEAALEELRKAGKARQTESGWELLSQVGRSWEDERRGIEVLPKHRQDLLRDAALQLLGEVGGYRHGGIKTFSLAPVVNGQKAQGSGGIELRTRIVLEPEGLAAARDAARQESNTESGQNAIHWVVATPDELLRVVDDLHRSLQMVGKYEREQLSAEESKLFSDEKTRQSTLRAKLTGQLKRAVVQGDSFFRGVQTPVADFGTDLGEAARGALRAAVPKLFPKFDMAAVQVKSAAEAAKILESDSLAGLSAVYGDGDGGLGLVVRQAGDYRIEPQRPAAQEVFGFIERQKNYGQKATGKLLETAFTGFGYGWDLEVVMLLTATLFRAGKIEVYHGKRYTSYTETGVLDVFRKPQVFRSATFAPREDELTFPMRVECAKALEELYGEPVSYHDEGALASAIRNHLPAERTRVVDTRAKLQANGLPGAEALTEFVTTLDGIGEGSAVDTIKAFHEQRDALRSGLARVARLEAVLAGSTLSSLRRAQDALHTLWPQLQAVGASEVAEAAADLAEKLGSPDFFEHLKSIHHRGEEIRQAHDARRTEFAGQLTEAVRRHVDDLRNRQIWEAVPEESRAALLRPFEQLVAKADAASGASLAELRSGVYALDGMHAEAVQRLVEAYEALSKGPDEPAPVVRRVRLSHLAPEGIRTEDEVEKVVGRIRAECLEAISRGETVVLE